MKNLKNKNEKIVLIVDDEEDLIEITAFYLEDVGFSTLTATNVQDALEVVKNNNVDFIVSDIRMPHRDGTELLRELRSMNSNVPVIFVSGFSDYTEEELVKMGAVATLAKPVDRLRLIDLICQKTAS
ncbi:MAG: hypothetical protein CL676_12745 [Bdellovibrionaceae bacterium]|nr:hypothetical protein [Pseudobdellovibrionaceae bacterium]|tara:strand:- start:124 stop:504 length:381 start_codon:yes stop_codon:yes gene_type:complete